MNSFYDMYYPKIERTPEELAAFEAGYDRIMQRAFAHHFQHLGVIWEWMSKAGPRSINGYPIFFSCRLMHREDWIRAEKAIIREQERRESIEL